MRSELTPTQQAEHLAKRKELWGMREVSAQVEPKPQGGRPAQFASDTAEATGAAKSSINRAISRAEGVTDEVRDEIRGTDLDKGTVLDDAGTGGASCTTSLLDGRDAEQWGNLSHWWRQD
ncbi:MAG: hypothetical protein AB3N23_10880 [Paracoccaceae bacterium]